jgi:hypothetical protein
MYDLENLHLLKDSELVKNKNICFLNQFYYKDTDSIAQHSKAKLFQLLLANGYNRGIY